MTLITNGHAPDAVYEEVRAHFSEKEICDLTLAVAAINAWNRLAISSRTVPGGYQAPAGEGCALKQSALSRVIFRAVRAAFVAR